MAYDDEMKKQQAVLKILDKYGSVSAVAKKLAISQPYASNFLTGKRKVPIKYVKKLVELAQGEVRKKDLRPDVYDD